MTTPHTASLAALDEHHEDVQVAEKMQDKT